MPAGSHRAYLLVGDAAVGSEPTIVSIAGNEVARSRRLRGGEFEWLDFALDGGDSGITVDLSLASLSGVHWHLVAFTIVDSTATAPDVVVGDVTPHGMLMPPGVPLDATFWLYTSRPTR